MEKVFVYGTLLNGEYNNQRCLQNAESRLIGEATVQGFDLHDLGPFPAVWYSDNVETEIVGEVWEVSPEVFARLDRLEGYPHFYDRVQVQTKQGIAWIYINEDAKKNPIIPSGSWRQHLQEKTNGR